MMTSWKKLALAGMASLALAACGQKADEPATPVEPAADAGQPAASGAGGSGPALWRTGDADTTIYLFGTVHVLPPDLTWRTQLVDDALAASSVVYFETDVNPDIPKLTGIVSRLGVYTPPEKLSDRLTPEDRATLADAAAKLSLPMFMLDTMRPWLAAMSLSEQLIVKAGYQPTSGVERTLDPIVRAAGKEIRRFETVEQQLLFFADLPEEVQIDYLMEGVRQIDEETDLLDDMVNAWARGDVAALEAIMIEGDLAESPEIYEALLVGRNRSWAEALDRLTKAETGTFFVAVGAGHLAGKDSVNRLLEGRGLKVERVE